MHVIDPWNRGEETVFSQWKLRSLDCGEHMDVSRFEITRVIEVKLFSIICLLADKSIAMYDLFEENLNLDLVY